MASDNKSLGRFVLDGIPPAPRGVPQIEVIFDVDSNGVLKVTAKDKSTGKEQSIKIEASSGLTDADIERMKREAEEHAGEDAKKKELIDTRNLAEQMVYTAEKALKDHGDKVPTEIKDDVTAKMTAVNEAKGTDDIAAIAAASEALSTSMQKIGEEMAKHQEEPKTETQNDSTEGTVRDADVSDNTEAK
jgi:molecular chaperone DnaK